MSSSSSSSSTSSLDHLLPSEQLCYVHCNICDTVLAVSVPCTSFFKTVTVRCGHCTNLLPVNMNMRGLLLPNSVNHFHIRHDFFPPSPNLMEENQGLQCSDMSMNQTISSTNRGLLPDYHHDYLCDQLPISPPVINKREEALREERRRENRRRKICRRWREKRKHHIFDGSSATTSDAHSPEKRQRVPSAYNRFIKDEIRRIKAGNPDISHREAFSAAAKNWAHFPHIQFGLMPDSDHQSVKKVRQQGGGEEVMTMDDRFFPSAYVGVSPY